MSAKTRTIRTLSTDRRERERACALDFLVNGNLDGRHDEICIHAEPCSRDYNIRPYPEAEVDPRLYEGTGIGLLYGLGGPSTLWPTLAGWNIVGTRERRVSQAVFNRKDDNE